MKDFVFQDILFEYDKIDSTNEEAKRMILSYKHKNCFVVLANTQTLGKGRMERNWHSDILGNIYMTIAINSKLCNDFEDILPLYTAFILMQAIGSKACYKWVNDIIIENKKVAGILIEKMNNFFIIGIGVNVLNHPQKTLFPAGNLKDFGINLSAIDIFDSFKNNLKQRKEFIINCLEERFFTKKEISINQGEFIGTFNKIKLDGTLVLKDKTGKLKEIHFGDISAF